ncbi:MAG: hypothetical protein IJ796_01790 [Lachnospiraceae bacterium]|nr:hypothetical protein [Lachnospiraceae bacterium]
MKNKRALQLLMTGMLIVCTLSACGGKEEPETTASVNTETEIPETTPAAEEVQETEEQTQSENSEENKNNETVTIQATMPYVFSEGLAWVRTDKPNQLAVVDTSGNIVFTLDNDSEGIKVSAGDSSKGITYDPIEATPFHDGASVVYPSRYLNAYGFAIYDSKGNLLTSSDDGDDATDMRFLAEGEGKYLIEKTTADFSENNTVIYCIDKNGNIISDEIEISGNLYGRKWNYSGNGNFTFGMCGIIDGKYIDFNDSDIYNNLDADTVKDCMVQIYGSEGVIPLCSWGGGGETYGYVNGLVGELYYAGEFAPEYEKILTELNDGNLNGWYDKDFNLVVGIPDYPDGVEVVELGQFKDGYAPVKLRGADGRFYFTLVDKAGNQMYEPVGGVENVASFNGWSYSLYNGNITFIGSDTSGRTYYLIDKDGTLYNLSEDISSFTGTVYADCDFESYAISVAEGFKYIPDGSMQYFKLDGTAFDRAVPGNNVVNVQFTLGYKK